mmetsp:Transcript_69612/g.220413  ORF Transcript_69612/g.220413 Transcript_69612/m.220413 type:complete len:216 (+) Transcript_69612:492-1139(+)
MSVHSRHRAVYDIFILDSPSSSNSSSPAVAPAGSLPPLAASARHSATWGTRATPATAAAMPNVMAPALGPEPEYASGMAAKMPLEDASTCSIPAHVCDEQGVPPGARAAGRPKARPAARATWADAALRIAAIRVGSWANSPPPSVVARAPHETCRPSNRKLQRRLPSPTTPEPGLSTSRPPVPAPRDPPPRGARGRPARGFRHVDMRTSVVAWTT